VLALNDAQLTVDMTAAGSLPVEKRSVFLERVAARRRSRRRDTSRIDGISPIGSIGNAPA
jgi:hypothetical protein